MASSVIVIGDKNLIRTLGKASFDVKEMRKVNKSAAAIVAAAAKAGAPKKSGRLAKSVRVGAATKRSGRVNYGGSRVPYAGVIHWGNPKRKIAAQPFVSEAGQGTEGAWVALYRAFLDEKLRSIKGA